MEMRFNDKMHQLKEIINQLSKALFANREGVGHNDDNQEVQFHNNKDKVGKDKQVFSPKMAKLKFPKFSEDNPTEWFNRVYQFFEFQGVTNAQKVLLASFHLKGWGKSMVLVAMKCL